MDMTYGLREKKKAQLKINLIETLIEELEHNTFDEIKVKTLCSKVGISEVTFFKYFEKKEELLQYYMQVWNYKREITFESNCRQEGIEGIRQIFADISATDNVVNILNSVSTLISRSKEKPKQIVLTPCEMWLLNDEKNPTMVPMGLSEQFMIHLEQAVVNGSLSSDLDLLAVDMILSSLFYGTPLIAHATGQNLASLYSSHLDLLFGPES